MSINVSIEVDKDTADVLRVRAAELGVTVPQLIVLRVFHGREAR